MCPRVRVSAAECACGFLNAVREFSLPTSCKLGIPIPRSSSVIHLKDSQYSEKPHLQFITMKGHVKISPERGVQGRAQVQAASCPLPVESRGQRSVLAAVCDKMGGVLSTRDTHLSLGIQTFSLGSVTYTKLTTRMAHLCSLPF